MRCLSKITYRPYKPSSSLACKRCADWRTVFSLQTFGRAGEQRGGPLFFHGMIHFIFYPFKVPVGSIPKQQINNDEHANSEQYGG